MQGYKLEVKMLGLMLPLHGGLFPTKQAAMIKAIEIFNNHKRVESVTITKLK